MRFAFITARKGRGKNMLQVVRKPVVGYAIEAAIESCVHKVYVCTDCPDIKGHVDRTDASILYRPPELSTDKSPHRDIIRHCAEKLKPHDVMVVLLGNTVMVTPTDIDRCVRMVESGEYDSAMTAWRAQDDHPMRAMAVSKCGFVKSFTGKDAGTNRQGYEPVYFYDQGVWAMRAHCAVDQAGPPPWVWLGKKCGIVERPWVTGRDIHDDIDISASEWYLNNSTVFKS